MTESRYRKIKQYKYELIDQYVYNIGVLGYEISHNFVKLDKEGNMTMERGYCWDGPSGPTIDTYDFIRGSLVHDAFYQLMRRDDLPKTYRTEADLLLKEICIEDGMPEIRAEYIYQAVRAFSWMFVHTKPKDTGNICVLGKPCGEEGEEDSDLQCS